jgi:hypothetical protein
MYFYWVPPVLLIEFAVAYVFQMRAADMTTYSGNSRAINIGRALAHILAVLVVSQFAPFGGAILGGVLMRGLAEKPVLGGACMLVGSAALFLLGVTLLDTLIDSALVVFGVQTKHLRVQDILSLEIPDVVLLMCVISVVML